MPRLTRSFFARDALEVAPDLLNKILVAGSQRGRIVEVEAYRGADDPASHGYRGPTPRTEVMYGPPGHLYVYFTYGMHWCANVVCGPVGECAAVLLRGLEPLDGIADMYQRRPKARRDQDLCSGPAKLCAAFGIDGSNDGVDLAGLGAGIHLVDDGTLVPSPVVTTARIGLSKATERPWRFVVADSPHLSRAVPSRWA